MHGRRFPWVSSRDCGTNDLWPLRGQFADATLRKPSTSVEVNFQFKRDLLYTLRFLLSTGNWAIGNSGENLSEVG
jgi:hypothetical protein